jgi:O-antigen/teichoic acid export membrane protein
MTPLLALAALPFCVVLAGFPDRVLHFAYGERFAGGGMSTLLALATVGVCLTFAKLPFDVGLLALRATRSIFYIYLIPVGLLLTAGVALIQAFELLGVPLSSILINAALLSATWVAYRRRLARAARGRKGDAPA